MRFVAMCDPADEWLVYDQWTGLPAEVEDKSLIGLSRLDAERLMEEANIRLLLLGAAAAFSPAKGI